jgi:hypothetical protein
MFWGEPHDDDAEGNPRWRVTRESDNYDHIMDKGEILYIFAQYEILPRSMKRKLLLCAECNTSILDMEHYLCEGCRAVR